MMHVDHATLRDLEVVPSPSRRGKHLWGMIDRTRSRVGSEVLRKRLLNPPDDASEILALQSAHRAFGSELEAYRQALDAAAPDDAERYLNMTWQLPDAMPPMASVRSWYPNYVRDVERGRPVVASLLESAATLGVKLAHADSPILQTAGAELREVMGDPSVQEVRHLARSSTAASRLRFDQLARSTAKSHISRLLELVGQLEAVWSISAATAEHGWVYPRPGSHWSVTGLFHPFIGREGVSNDLHLGAQVRVCFITGPNMAGKSTFLKAAALAQLLAHLGSGVPAAAMEFAPAGTLFSSVDIADNVTDGESFYLAEVRRIGALAGALSKQKSAVAILDEPFRGTNVHDAAEATIAVVTRLVDHPAALVFVSSHVAEVVPTLSEDPRIAFLHFSAELSGPEPHFDYRLREGVSNQRLGMTLLRQERVLDRLEQSVSTGRLNGTATDS